jgi:hypothetical protein
MISGEIDGCQFSGLYIFINDLTFYPQGRVKTLETLRDRVGVNGSRTSTARLQPASFSGDRP